jgi:transcription factor E2F3
LWLKDELNEINNEEDEQKEQMILELDKLDKEEAQLDTWIDSMKSNFEKLTEDSDFKQYGYVTFEDIKSLTNGENINLIAIKAPPGTSLDIPDPDMIHNIYIKTKEVQTLYIEYAQW